MIDAKMLLSEDQAVTTVGDHASINMIDFGAADLGDGGNIYLNVVCTEDLASGGSATIQIKLQTSSDGSSWTTMLETEALAYAGIDAGERFPYTAISLPAGDLGRYFRLVYVVGTAALTAGKFTAWLDTHPIND